MEEQVDIFLTWVDDTDVQWQQEKNIYANFATKIQEDNNGIQRYRNWENLKYVFRGIEKYLPWVRKVFFVTCGQIPNFLDSENEKLVLIHHEDYIPQEYLPTFNSNTIEMNLFRIEELAENVLLFNDDTFIIDFIEKEYFLNKGLPGDEAIERIIGNPPFNHAHCMVNNAYLINKHFDKRNVKRENLGKWYSLAYGKNIFRNIFMNYFKAFEGLKNPHEPLIIKKSILSKLWELEPEILHEASKNKFRNLTDITWYVVRYWNIFEGNFSPRMHRGRALTVTDENYRDIKKMICEKRYPIISIDEDYENSLCNIDEAKQQINSALEFVLPEKCSFEK